MIKKGKEYKVFKMLRTTPIGKPWCLECDDPNLDSEALAVFNAQTFQHLFGTKRSDMSQRKQRLCVLRIEKDDRKIYRNFQSHSIKGLTIECIGLSPDSFTELDLADKVNQKVIIKKSFWFPFYWYHPNSAKRVSFRIGFIALLVGIAGCVLTIAI